MIAKPKRPERRKNPNDTLLGRRKSYFRRVRAADVEEMPPRIIEALWANPHGTIRFKAGVDASGREIFGVAKFKNPGKPKIEEILLLTTRRAGAK